MADLVLRGGRVIDPANGRDETTDIAFGEGKVAAVGHDLPGGRLSMPAGSLSCPG
jgi:dihydroorotase